MPTSPNVTPPRLWLASSSPRRQQLLASLGFTFKVSVSNADEAENISNSVKETVLENANRKAAIVVAKVPDDTDVVIAADTLVALDGRILSKPRDRKEALEFLRAYSGNTHQVLTGLSLASRHFGKRSTAVETKVTFRKLENEEMEAYVDTQEPYDKAGGYGIQGLACLFVDRIEGSYSNVMGLPIEVLLKELSALVGVSPDRWFRK